MNEKTNKFKLIIAVFSGDQEIGQISIPPGGSLTVGSAQGNTVVIPDLPLKQSVVISSFQGSFHLHHVPRIDGEIDLGRGGFETIDMAFANNPHHQRGGIPLPRGFKAVLNIASISILVKTKRIARAKNKKVNPSQSAPLPKSPPPTRKPTSFEERKTQRPMGEPLRMPQSKLINSQRFVDSPSPKTQQKSNEKVPAPPPIAPFAFPELKRPGIEKDSQKKPDIDGHIKQDKPLPSQATPRSSDNTSLPPISPRTINNRKKPPKPTPFSPKKPGSDSIELEHKPTLSESSPSSSPPPLEIQQQSEEPIAFSSSATLNAWITWNTLPLFAAVGYLTLGGFGAVFAIAFAFIFKCRHDPVFLKNLIAGLKVRPDIRHQKANEPFKPAALLDWLRVRNAMILIGLSQFMWGWAISVPLLVVFCIYRFKIDPAFPSQQAKSLLHFFINKGPSDKEMTQEQTQQRNKKYRQFAFAMLGVLYILCFRHIVKNPVETQLEGLAAQPPTWLYALIMSLGWWFYGLIFLSCHQYKVLGQVLAMIVAISALHTIHYKGFVVVLIGSSVAIVAIGVIRTIRDRCSSHVTRYLMALFLVIPHSSYIGASYQFPKYKEQYTMTINKNQNKCRENCIYDRNTHFQFSLRGSSALFIPDYCLHERWSIDRLRKILDEKMSREDRENIYEQIQETKDLYNACHKRCKDTCDEWAAKEFETMEKLGSIKLEF